jgi:hypothetical protein
MSAAHVNSGQPLVVDTTYRNQFVAGVNSFINSNPNTIVMLDCHCYLNWMTVQDDNTVTTDQNGTPRVWQAIIEACRDDSTAGYVGVIDFSNLYIWLELQNEPLKLTNYLSWQDTITTIRNLGLNNKIVLGAEQGGDTSYGKFAAYNGYSSYQVGNGFWKYGEVTNYTNVSFPRDPRNNLCISLHNYVDKSGAGTDYQNQLTLAQTQNIYTSTLRQAVFSKIQGHNIDIILGETGIPTVAAAVTNNNYQNGIASINYLLQNFIGESTTLLPQSFKGNNTSNQLLRQNMGGYILGYAHWTIPALPNSDNHSYDQSVLTNVVSNLTNVEP